MHTVSVDWYGVVLMNLLNWSYDTFDCPAGEKRVTAGRTFSRGR